MEAGALPGSRGQEATWGARRPGRLRRGLAASQGQAQGLSVGSCLQGPLLASQVLSVKGDMCERVCACRRG